MSVYREDERECCQQKTKVEKDNKCSDKQVNLIFWDTISPKRKVYIMGQREYNLYLSFKF